MGLSLKKKSLFDVLKLPISSKLDWSSCKENWTLDSLYEISFFKKNLRLISLSLQYGFT